MPTKKNINKKTTPPIAKNTNGKKGVVKPNPEQLYKYYYNEGVKQASSYGMTDRYDIKDYANKYATGKGSKKPKG